MSGEGLLDLFPTTCDKEIKIEDIRKLNASNQKADQKVKLLLYSLLSKKKKKKRPPKFGG